MCKNYINACWEEFDDERVSRIKCIEDYIDNNGANIYLLFYELVRKKTVLNKNIDELSTQVLTSNNDNQNKRLGSSISISFINNKKGNKINNSSNILNSSNNDNEFNLNEKYSQNQRLDRENQNLIKRSYYNSK